jgi:hypothetical protein
MRYCGPQLPDVGTFDESDSVNENEYIPFRRGPVAQLGARFHGMEEVVGSIPTRSTISLNNLAIALENRGIVDCLRP